MAPTNQEFGEKTSDVCSLAFAFGVEAHWRGDHGIDTESGMPLLGLSDRLACISIASTMQSSPWHVPSQPVFAVLHGQADSRVVL